MKWTFRRTGGHPSARSFVGSLLVHGGVGILAVLATMREPTPLTFITYEVEIVSPPPSRSDEPEPEPAAQEELVVERPDETPSEEAPDEVPLPEAEPEPVEPDPEPAEEEPAPTPEPVEEEPAPTPTEETSDEELTGEDIEVRMEGLRQDFPEYYENIIRQIRRCFRPTAGIPGNLTTTIYFVIRSDGTTADVAFRERSGNPDLDFDALAAVADCAGREGRFGPLPEGLPYERLPIIFEFRGSGDGVEAFASARALPRALSPVPWSPVEASGNRADRTGFESGTALPTPGSPPSALRLRAGADFAAAVQFAFQVGTTR